MSAKNLNSFTVAELIEKLSKCDPTAKVVFEHPAHDHWRTMLAGSIKSVETDRTAKWSGYHEQFAMVTDEDNEGVNFREQNHAFLRDSDGRCKICGKREDSERHGAVNVVVLS